MLPVRVIPLPAMLNARDCIGHTVVVFDVLRATTTMAAALGAGATEIRAFGSLDACRTAAGAFSGSKIMLGEKDCLPPDDFDLGNSPGDCDVARCHGKALFMSTSNGTRALIAARAASVLLAGAIVNARATAVAAMRFALPITLLCAGTNDQIAMEDLLGCGAVMSHLPSALLANDEARIAQALWRDAAPNLLRRLEETRGGQNVISAGLRADMDFAASIDCFSHACRVYDLDNVLVVRREAGYDSVT